MSFLGWYNVFVFTIIENLWLFVGCFSLKINSSIIYYIQTSFSSFLPPLLAPQWLPFFPRSIPSPFTLQRRAVGIQETLARQDQAKYNKKEESPSYQGWTRQPNRREIVSRECKRVRGIPSPIFQLVSNCLLHSYVYMHRLVQLPDFTREQSLVKHRNSQLVNIQSIIWFWEYSATLEHLYHTSSLQVRELSVKEEGSGRVIGEKRLKDDIGMIYSGHEQPTTLSSPKQLNVGTLLNIGRRGSHTAHPT